MSENYLTLLVFLPILFALIVPFISDREDGKYLHGFALGASVALFILSWWFSWVGGKAVSAVTLPWFPELGINFALGTDGLSNTLIVLTTFLLIMACGASITGITKRLKLYYSMLFVLTTAVLGVFVARDAFLFFLFWELELIPMYLLIAIWGGPRRDYAAMKFILYTLFGSVFLVAGLLWLYFHAQSTLGADPTKLFMFDTLKNSAQVGLPLASQVLIFIALFITFGVKLPVVPFHTWLPDAHVEAPTPVSMLLAGILLKMGAYGMMRFCFEFLPSAAHQLAPWLAALAVINIVYTAGVALVQKDLKKLIAYSSVSHMGFVLLGLAAMNAVGYTGAVFVMFSHGIVSAALFMCVGTLYVRTHTRMIADYGGFGSQVPKLFYFFMFMSMASLGLPLLISFAGESLVFYGSFLSEVPGHLVQLLGGLVQFTWSMKTAAILSAIGVILGAAYLLWMLQRVFFGALPSQWNKLPDAYPSELFVLATLSFIVLVFGFYPKLLTDRYVNDVTAMVAQRVEQPQADPSVLISSGAVSSGSSGFTGEKE